MCQKFATLDTEFVLETIFPEITWCILSNQHIIFERRSQAADAASGGKALEQVAQPMSRRANVGGENAKTKEIHANYVILFGISNII